MIPVSSAFNSLTISPSFPPLTVTGGTIQLLEGPSGGGFPTEDPTSLSPNPSNGLIQTDQACNVKVTWSVGGLFNSGLTADYICTAYFERMGVSEATQNFTAQIAHVQQVATFNYAVNIPIPAGSLQPGVYHLVVSLTTEIPSAPGPGIGVPIVGFVDMGCVQIYQS